MTMASAHMFRILVAFLLLCASPSGSTLLPAVPLSRRSGATASLRSRRKCNAIGAPRARRDHVFGTSGRSSGQSRCPAAFVDPTAAVASVSAFARSSPLVTAFVSCAINGAAADWIAQSSEAVRRASEASAAAASAAASASNLDSDGPSPSSSDGSAVADIGRGGFLSQYNYRRSLAFILYGGCYQGMALELIYNGLFTRIFGPQQVLLKVAASQFLLAPLVTLPVAYVFKGLVFGNTFRASIENYWEGVTQKGLLLSFWKLWIPIQFLVFAVVPMHFRIPFSACFSFLWTVMLSRIANS